MNLFLLAQEAVNKTTSWWIWIIVIFVIVMLPWVALVVYLCVKKYRVRLFDNNILIGTYYFKADESLSNLVLPKKEGYIIEGLYRDPEFMLPLEYNNMPKSNLKIYIKWQIQD